MATVDEIEAGARVLAKMNGYEVTARVPSMVDDREFPKVAEFVAQAKAVLFAAESVKK